MLDKDKIGSGGSSVEHLRIALPDEDNEQKNFGYHEVHSEEVENMESDFNGKRQVNLSESNNSANDPVR